MTWNNPLPSIFSEGTRQIQALMFPLVPFSFSAMSSGSLPCLSSFSEMPPPHLEPTLIKPIIDTPFLFPLCSSAEKLCISPFYLRSYPLASLKQWYFVFCVCISKLLPILTFTSSGFFHGTVERIIIAKIHSIPSYNLNQMPGDWKYRAADYRKY